MQKFFLNWHGGISIAKIDEDQDSVWVDGELADQYDTVEDFLEEHEVFDTLQEAAASAT